MTPATRIQNALAAWPGREADVADELGIAKSTLRVWQGKPGPRCNPPTEVDAAEVERAVRVLLVDRLSRLCAIDAQ